MPATRGRVEELRHLGLREYLRFGVSNVWVTDDVRVDLGDTIKVVDMTIERNMRLMEMIVVDPNIQRGEPVIRGTRITAYTIAKIVEEGAAIDEILHDYPTLDAEKIEAACLYANAHPRPDRPSFPKGGKEVFRMSVADLTRS